MTRKKVDLGLGAVERAFRDMAIDEEWSLREDRGFTWWGAWVRQRIWAGEAVRSDGETLWHVRARTPAYADQPDGPATYALVNDLNEIPATSAYVYDPDDGTISARCGAFTYDAVAPWIERFLLSATALQASIAFAQVPAASDGRQLDDEPHPAAGPRRDPDDMLNLAEAMPQQPSPFTASAMRRVAATLAGEGLAVSFDEEGEILLVPAPSSSDVDAVWAVASSDHPFLGPGAFARLSLVRTTGPLRATWQANALNLAEAADWAGEHRPHALGAWKSDAGHLFHDAFFPAGLFGQPDGEGALVAIRNLFAWGALRARFAGERLPWLDAAAAARYPDDEAPDADVPGDDDEAAGHPGDEGAPGPTPTTVEAPEVPVTERSFGPASRTPRPRDPSLGRRTPRELVVDPSDAAAFTEIDDAVAVAEDGDRIVVRPGTYRRPVVIDRAVAIRGEGDVESVLLEPVGGEALGVAASGATVTGLSIRPARAGNDGADHSAVAVRDAAVTIEGCLLTSHLGATVWVGGPASRAVLLGCTLTGGAQNAVWVVEEGRAEMAACRVRGHRWAVTVGGPHASLSIVDCEIVDNLDGGIAAAEMATLVVERTTVSRNAGTGIHLGDPTPASRVEDCTIEGNSAFGVLVRGGRGAAVLRSRIRDNAVGIVVVDGATPRIEGNELAGTATGIGVRGEGSDPVVAANTISGGRHSGVIVDEAAAGRFDGNTVSGSAGAGVWVDDAGTRPFFSGNHVSSSAFAGILVTDGAGGDFQANDLRGNAAGSWKLDEPGELRRTGNLEDTGVPPEATRPDPPAPGPHLVN